MNFLLTNDDGIDAPGLATLAKVLARLGCPLVLAPDRHLSGCSHQATTDRHLRITPLADGRSHLDGTPADCVRVGLVHLHPQVDWVFSGINDGGNLGADVYLSGTVAAAREAALLGKPAVAVSQYRRRGASTDWQRTARWTERVIGQLMERGLSPGEFWNVNLPDAELQEEDPVIVFCPLDTNPLPVQFHQQDGRLLYQGPYHDRARTPALDVDVCFSGRIAVTCIRLG